MRSLIGTALWKLSVGAPLRLLVGEPHHLVGDIDTYDLLGMKALANQTRRPSRTATEVKHALVSLHIHQRQHRFEDRHVMPLHLVAAAGFRPLVEFLL